MVCPLLFCYRQDGYRETGAGDANLTFDDERMNSLRSALGVRLSGSFNDKANATLGLSWVHEFLDTEARLNPAFAVNGNVPFSIDGPTTDRDRLQATLGVGARLSKTSQFDLDYNGEFAKTDDHHAITATYRMQW